MDSLKEAGTIASAIKSIASIVVGIVIAVSSAAFAYSKIYENERNLAQFKEDLKRKYDLLIQRSDKRHNRTVSYVKDLKSMHQSDEHRIIELEKSLSELKGYLKAYRETK